MRYYNTDDKNKIIKHYDRDGDFYKVSYLDDTEAKYYNSLLNHEEYLKNIMLEQALKRDNDYSKNYKSNLLKEVFYYMSSILFISGISVFIDKRLFWLLCLGVIGCFISLKKCSSFKLERKEIEKYRIYISMYKETLLEKNRKVLEKFSEKNYSGKVIDINNIDYYDKRELKKIKRKLMY